MVIVWNYDAKSDKLSVIKNFTSKNYKQKWTTELYVY